MSQLTQIVIEHIVSLDPDFSDIAADDIELADIVDRNERIEAVIDDITQNFRDDTRNEHSKLITRLMNAYEYTGKRTPLRKRILSDWYWDNHGDGNSAGLY